MARDESLGQAIADESRSALDAYVREGARQMLQAALECEVDAFLAEYADRADEHGRKQVVRNAYLPARTIMTGAGPLEIEQPRVRDKSRHADKRVVFTSGILPPYLRKSRSIEELIPWLYLKGVSTGDYPEALQALLGKDAKGFSPNVVVRLKEKWGHEYEEWSRRDLSGEEYVYIWADGIHVNVRLEDAANPKQCLLVLMGATAEGPAAPRCRERHRGTGPRAWSAGCRPRCRRLRAARGRPAPRRGPRARGGGPGSGSRR